MKRRNFLKGLIATPAAASVTKLEAAIPEIEWQPKVFDYGGSGVLEVHIVSSKRHKIEAVATYPENDWVNGCVRENIFKTGVCHSYAWTEDNKPVPRPFILAIPVNELTRVQVWVDDELVAVGRPKFAGKNYMFEPWLIAGVGIPA